MKITDELLRKLTNEGEVLVKGNFVTDALWGFVAEGMLTDDEANDWIDRSRVALGNGASVADIFADLGRILRRHREAS